MNTKNVARGAEEGSCEEEARGRCSARVDEEESQEDGQGPA
jgi:hypothetical protein